jgi:hypothetical protein
MNSLPRSAARADADEYGATVGSQAGAGLRRAIRRGLETPFGRRALQAARVLAAPRELAVRRAVAVALLRHARPAIRIDPRRGFARVPARAGDGEHSGAPPLPNVELVLAHCRREVRAIRPDLDAIHASLSGKARLTVDLFHDGLHARSPEFAEFMLQDEILLTVIEYFRTVPFLSRIGMAHSIHVPELARPDFHQRFHVDNDDFRHVKLFVNAIDVSADDGPLSFLPADVSARVLRALRREGKHVGLRTTFSDEEVFRHCAPSDLVRLIGPAGTAAFVDLSRCLHFGSRVRVHRERFILAAAFLRYHRIHVNQSTQFTPRTGLDRVRTLVMRSPQRYPSGYFCPDPRLVLHRDETPARVVAAPR